MKKTIALTSALLILTVTGCGSQNADTTAESALTKEPINEASSQDTTPQDNSTAADPASTSKDITLTTNYYISKRDGVERSTGKYTAITFSDELSAKYPGLSETIGNLTSSWEDSISNEVAANAYFYDPAYMDDMTLFNDLEVNIIRLDDKMFTMLTNSSSFTGGVHPNYYTDCYNIDPISGKNYTLSDVLSKPDEFPSIIRESFKTTEPELLEEIDSFFFEEGDVFEDKLKNGNYTFYVNDKGLHIIFSPYEIASYAAGTIERDFTYEEYPDLVLDAFKMSAPADIESRITRIEGSTTEVEPKEYYGNEYEDVEP